jgi:ribosome maturation factor RimP
MDLLKENIIGISGEIAEKLGFFVIDVIFRGDSRKQIIEIYIDGEKSVTADNLAEISHQLNSAIEEKDLLQKSYRLDVSTPGVDRPLKFLKQFPKHINRNFEVTYKSSGETKTITGKLVSVDENNLSFYHKDGNNLIRFSDIIKAKVLISFS